MTNNLWREYRSAIQAGDFSLALSVARQGVEVQAVKGDLRHAGIWQRAVSNALFLQGRCHEAISEARRSAKLQPDSYERALSLVALGQMKNSAGLYKAALTEFARAMTIAADHQGDVYLWSHFYANRAFTFCKLGRIDRAIVDWEGAAQLMREAGYGFRAAIYLNNIGFSLAEMASYEEAEQRLLEALELLEQDPHPHTEGLICDSLGYVYTMTDDSVNAERFLRRSAKMFTKLGDNQQLVGTLLHFSEFYLHTRYFETARDETLRALELAIKVKSDHLVAQAREQLKRVMHSQLEENLSPWFRLHRRNTSLVRRVIHLRQVKDGDDLDPAS